MEGTIVTTESVLKEARQKWALSNWLMHATDSREAFQTAVAQREKLAQKWQDALEKKVQTVDLYFKASVRRLRAEDEATAARIARIDAEVQRRAMKMQDAIATDTVLNLVGVNMQDAGAVTATTSTPEESNKTPRHTALRRAEERRWEREEEERQRALEQAW